MRAWWALFILLTSSSRASSSRHFFGSCHRSRARIIMLIRPTLGAFSPEAGPSRTRSRHFFGSCSISCFTVIVHSRARITILGLGFGSSGPTHQAQKRCSRTYRDVPHGGVPPLLRILLDELLYCLVTWRALSCESSFTCEDDNTYRDHPWWILLYEFLY